MRLKNPEKTDKLFFNQYLNSLGKFDTNLNYAHKLSDKVQTTLLLHAENEPAVRAVLERIDAIAALGIAPAAATPAYWCTLANRLAARLPLPGYSAERHAAWLAGRALP